MSDFQAAACSHCNEATEPGDHYEIDDGTIWHVGCYQHAMIEAGHENPFKPCNHCETLIWETDPVQRGQVFVGHEAHDAWWHPECAPGSDTPDEEDRVDHPPPQPRSLNDRLAAEPEPASEYGVANPYPLGTPCHGCEKPIQRGLIMHGPLPFHRGCRDKYVKTQTREAKADKKIVARSMTKRRGRVECDVCNKTMSPADLGDQNKFVEWDDPDEPNTLKVAHRLCYRWAMMKNGHDDPYEGDGPLDPTHEPLPGESKDNPRIYCGVCENLGSAGKYVLRNDYQAHMADHEVKHWKG